MAHRSTLVQPEWLERRTGQIGLQLRKSQAVPQLNLPAPTSEGCSNLYICKPSFLTVEHLSLPVFYAVIQVCFPAGTALHTVSSG